MFIRRRPSCQDVVKALISLLNVEQMQLWGIFPFSQSTFSAAGKTGKSPTKLSDLKGCGLRDRAEKHLSSWNTTF